MTLLNCPFCNSEAKMYDDMEHLDIKGYIPTFYGIRCTQCSCKMEFYKAADKQFLIDDWNKRFKK